MMKGQRIFFKACFFFLSFILVSNPPAFSEVFSSFTLGYTSSSLSEIHPYCYGHQSEGLKYSFHLKAKNGNEQVISHEQSQLVNFLKFPVKFRSFRPSVSLKNKSSFLGGIFPAKDVPSRRMVAKLGIGLANEFSGFSWQADRDQFKDGGSIYPLHLGLTLQISMFHGLFFDIGYQMNKEFTKTFAKSKGSGAVNYTEIFAILNLIPPGSFSVDSEGKSYNEGYIGIGIARYVNKEVELRGKVADWDLCYEDNFGFLVKAGGQAHKVKWAQPFGIYGEVTLKYVKWKLKKARTKPWNGDWEELTVDEALDMTTEFTNIGIELRFGALLPIL